MCEHAPNDVGIVELVRASLADGRLRTDAQPIVCLATGETISEELLIRLVTQKGEELPPSSFVPAAERHGLMPRIDRFMIERAAAHAAKGRSVHVNLSGTTLSDRALFGDILTAVHTHRAEPTRMTFEVTETAAAANMESAAELADKLRAFGFKIALDDFGSGWGSFRYLSALPIDMIKIDREFLSDLVSNPRSAQLVRGVVALASTLGVQTVGEGVEDESTLTALRALGVDFAQGFHVGQPRSVGLTKRRRGGPGLRLAS